MNLAPTLWRPARPAVSPRIAVGAHEAPTRALQAAREPVPFQERPGQKSCLTHEFRRQPHRRKAHDLKTSG